MSTAQKITLQGLAFAGAMFAPQANGITVFHSETAASMVWKSEALPSTTSVTISIPLVSSVEKIAEALDVLSLAALAGQVFPESRAMETWEKQATDDFFLSHFD